MEIKFNSKTANLVKKFQEGGEIAPQEPAAPAPAPEEAGAAQGEDRMQQILQAAAQAVQNQDAQLALQVCQALVEAAQGGAPAQEAPGEPVYRKGGKLLRRI